MPMDYIEPLADSGRPGPESARLAPTLRTEAIDIDRPFPHASVTAAASAEPNETAKQAPAVSLGGVRAIGGIASNPTVALRKRAIAAGIIINDVRYLRAA